MFVSIVVLFDSIVILLSICVCCYSIVVKEVAHVYLFGM